MYKSWWKILSVVLLVYTFIAGFLIKVPDIGNLKETIRNLFFHVPMWFAQITLLTISLAYSILYLRKPNLKHDIFAESFAKTGIFLGVLGLLTGAIWSTYTWGEPWSNDPKQIGVAIGLLVLFAYLVLRNSVTDLDKRARIAAVYNIFAFAMLFPTLWIIPRMVESLHPGGMGNPAFNTEDIDSRMRIIYWFGAVPGWTLLGLWMTSLRIRLKKLEEQKYLA